MPGSDQVKCLCGPNVGTGPVERSSLGLRIQQSKSISEDVELVLDRSSASIYARSGASKCDLQIVDYNSYDHATSRDLSIGIEFSTAGFNPYSWPKTWALQISVIAAL